MTRRVSVRCASVHETERCAAALATLVAPGQVVVLTGSLGAGKTTFVKAYARALGVTTPVTSPSYTLVHHYRCGPSSPVAVLLHVDMWRLRGEAEVDDLGLDEPLADGAAAIVEWGERFLSALQHDVVRVRVAVVDETTRELAVDLAAASLPDDAIEALAGLDAR